MAHIDKASIEGQTVEKLVLDTAAFIKQVRFERIGKEFYTIPAVVKEIRDNNAKKFYETFPYEIVLKEPHPLAFQAVVDFAKKTGDYAALSVTDLKVLALQYTLEREANGGDLSHLRTEPQQAKEITERNNPFFAPTEVEGKPIGVGDWGEGEDSGWINPDNLTGYTSSFAENLAPVGQEAKLCKVACLTLDFAMQNVMLQMNMNLVSADGVAIKSVQKYVKRCLSCRIFVKDMELEYCKACGSAVLQKLSYTVNQDGVINYNLPRHKPSLRGTIYAIPTPKSSKQKDQIYLTPQQLPRQRNKGSGMDWDDPDAVFLENKSGRHTGPTLYAKRNPNQSRRKIGKKNKSQGQQQ
eukprot:TRINITY_DN13123_c0_g1_i1.p1 TRINITY_DN13123_c0_g1~~TRINITY_DN13123_c0_g1_i1.p1  ORF type:complete len:353 (-),score=88.83 TRINITY_DN13123_c0_g1_i1:93-1151(-)